MFGGLMAFDRSSSDDPLSVFMCDDDTRCPGGTPGSACGANLKGQACAHCEKGSILILISFSMLCLIHMITIRYYSISEIINTLLSTYSK